MRMIHFLNLFVWLCLFSLLAVPAHAETIDPSVWQNNSIGLLTTSNSLKKTAGLGFQLSMLDDKSWPQIMTPGGVVEYYTQLVAYDENGDPLGIQLGQVKIPSTPFTSFTQSSNWSRNTLDINSGLLKLTISRMTLATLVSTTSNSVQLFAGNVTGATTNGTNVTNKTPSPSSPKYIAYHTASGYKVAALQNGNLSLSDMDQNWVLVWYGANSHFLDIKVPDHFSTKNGIGYGGETTYLKQNLAYQSDMPILITFQNNPNSIIQHIEGGIKLDFAIPAGDMSIMPLLGRDHPEASITDDWGTRRTLPNAGRYNVISQIEFWVPRSCNFPQNVNETYTYNELSDTATIQDDIEYKQICSSGITFAPIPPTVALAKNILGIEFSGVIRDSNTHSMFGPLHGIDNTNSYSWTLTGLKKYTNQGRRLTDTGVAPIELTQKLQEQIDNIINSGHLAPWLFNDKMPVNFMQGELFWMNLADSLYQLAETIEVLPEPQKSQLINYMRSERENVAYNPETVFNLNHTQGQFRPDFSITKLNDLNEWGSKRPHGREDAFLDRVPLYSFYGIERYHKVSGDDIGPNVIINANKAMTNDLSDVDWTTFSEYLKPKLITSLPGTGERRKKEAVVETNRVFAGLVGYIRIAEKLGDKHNEHIARALLARVAVLRIFMLRYPRYLYDFGFVDIPFSSPKWSITMTAGKSGGSTLANYDWKSGNDDTRQVAVLDQFETRLLDFKPDTFQVRPYYTAYRDMTPELFRYLSDYAKEELMIYSKKARTADPLWYMSLQPATLGSEHGLNFPVDAFQLFMTQAIVEKDTPENLQSYLDVPWLTTGDLFYTQKLAETIRAYRGWEWETGSGTPCTLNADFDCNGSVNIVDLSMLLSNFGKSSVSFSQGDADGDKQINTVDLMILLSNYGKTSGQ